MSKRNSIIERAINRRRSSLRRLAVLETPFGYSAARLFFSDRSFWVLILSNLVTIGWALAHDWTVDILIWAYWWQNVGIGVFWFIKILSLNPNTSPEAGGSAEDDEFRKFDTGFKFLLGYGLFHYGYYIALRSFFPDISPFRAWPIAVVFLVCHGFSFFYKRKWELSTISKIDCGEMLIIPFMRILPMHLTFIFFGMILEIKNIVPFPMKVILVFFIVLKMVPDAYMHEVERSLKCAD
jgi:hypothetical protein